MPALLKGLRQARRTQFGTREVKMLRPICKECQRGSDVPRNWYESCTHEPYVGIRGETITERKYEDVIVDGSPTGERILVGTEEKKVERPWPNFVPVSGSVINNSGLGVEKGRLKGFILPNELRCAAYPDGIKDCCEFRECYTQEGLKTYKSGTYCRDLEAAIVYERSRTIEIHNMERRQDQLDQALAKVRQ